MCVFLQINCNCDSLFTAASTLLQKGLNWLIKLHESNVNGILADEMGLGKTLQTISILAYIKERLGVSGPHIIIVPKTTLGNWMREFGKWCPSFNVLKFYGNKEDRIKLIRFD
jgi:SWI/SNF-related matrix-associated actin-dependent regulator of chromatin subfamily A member 5